MSVSIQPGEVYYDILPDGRYERCVLQPTTEDTPNRTAAARGGTGQFFRPIPRDELTEERMDAAAEMVVTGAGFVFLEAIS